MPNIAAIAESSAEARNTFAPSPNLLGKFLVDVDTTVELAKTLAPSLRGELEITDLNNLYLHNDKLEVILLDSGTAWLDAGTPDSLLEAAHFIQTIQKRQLIQVACIEEIALKQNFISKKQFEKIASAAPKNRYGEYLRDLSKDI